MSILQLRVLPCSSIRTIQILRDLIDLDKVGYGSQKCPHKQYSPTNMLCDFPHCQGNPKQQMGRVFYRDVLGDLTTPDLKQVMIESRGRQEQLQFRA